MKVTIKIRKFLHPLLLHSKLRFWFGYLRYIYYGKIRKSIRTLESDNAIKNTLSHNLSAFNNIKVDFSMNRMEHLIHAVLAIEYISKDSKILIIGPRTENDLLLFKGYGYTNVIGLDLISYSPLIQLGDMHKLEFPNDTFDVIISAWCFTYSNNPELVISESIRVLKNDGIFAIGFDHWPYSQEISDRLFGVDDNLIKVNPNRVQSSGDIIKFIDKNIKHIFFNYDAPMKLPTLQSLADLNTKGAFLIMLVCSIRK